VIKLVIIFISAFVLAALITGLLRNYAISRHLIDIPNARSSHKTPIPRGGGFAIVVVFVCGLFALSFMNYINQNTMSAIFGAGILVALIGFLDDHSHISAKWRLLAHFAAAGWGLYFLGGFPPLVMPIQTLNLGFINIDLNWFFQIIGLFYLVWLLNLYNFMDGIDGLAGIEAITACFGGAFLYMMVTHQTTDHFWIVPALMMVIVAGFLIWNFPVAKIFMGDVGSGFLGIVVGLFSLQSAWVMPQLFWCWLILLAVFIVDATITLIRRYLHGEVVYQAHCNHAYQHAARFYSNHITVTLAVGLINMFWLFPIAILVGLNKIHSITGFVVAYLPLILVSFHFHAGLRIKEE
jgi:Fuc2NAc and GlcNAc transferase